MKPFFLAFVPLLFLLLAASCWSALASFPLPGSDPVPAEVFRRGALAGPLFEILILPARWAGSAAMFVGPALWAGLFGFLVAFFVRRLAFRRQAIALSRPAV